MGGAVRRRRIWCDAIVINGRPCRLNGQWHAVHAEAGQDSFEKGRQVRVNWPRLGVCHAHAGAPVRDLSTLQESPARAVSTRVRAGLDSGTLGPTPIVKPANPSLEHCSYIFSRAL